MFFTDVKVPVENRAAENMGWTYAKYLPVRRGGNPTARGFARNFRAAEARSPSRATARSDHGRRHGGCAWTSNLGLECSSRVLFALASGQNQAAVVVIKLRHRGDAAGQVGGRSRRLLQPFPEQRNWNDVEPIGRGVGVLAPRYFNGRKMTITAARREMRRGIMARRAGVVGRPAGAFIRSDRLSTRGRVRLIGFSRR